jgi:hypothetical protein
MRPSFLLYPALADLSYRPGRDFAGAFSAVLSYGRPPYNDFVERLWVNPPEHVRG